MNTPLNTETTAASNKDYFIVLTGINHMSAPTEIREKISVPSDKMADLNKALVMDDNILEVVILSTCNRTEIIFHAKDPQLAEQKAKKTFMERAGYSKDISYTMRNLDAARHLMEVTSSLDSLVIGEPHILGQVRQNFETARKAGTVGKVLGRLFIKALETGKKIRRETSLGKSPISVSSIALDLAVKVFGSLAGSKILVLGAGEMGRQTAILSKYRGAEKITVCNRTRQKAIELAAIVDGETVPFDNMKAAFCEADVVITSVLSKQPVITSDFMQEVMSLRQNHPIFLIDIAVPRNIESSVDKIYNVYRYDLDDLNQIAALNEKQRKESVPEVVKLIDKALRDLDGWLREQSVIPAIINLRDKAESIRKCEVANHLRKMESINDHDSNLINSLSRAIIKKLLHEPTVRLKESATKGTESTHENSIRYLFALDEKKDSKD